MKHIYEVPIKIKTLADMVLTGTKDSAVVRQCIVRTLSSPCMRREGSSFVSN